MKASDVGKVAEVAELELLEDCGWASITATDLWWRARLLGVPASTLLP